MRILLLSDLHLELWRECAPQIDVSVSQPDVVILAGDINAGAKAVAWAAETFASVPVLYVAGNHEFYGHWLDRVPTEIRAACEQTGNLKFLDCDEVVIGDVRFLGCTLWTDFQLYGRDQRQAAMRAAEAGINDYNRIRIQDTGYRKIRAADTEKLHVVHRNWLREPVIRANDTELDQIAAILNAGGNITIYGGSGCRGAHAEIMATAALLNAPIARTSRAKDALQYDNPYDIGMTGLIGNESGYRAVLECDTLLLLGADFAWSQFYPSKARIIQIDIDPCHIGRRHPVEVGVVGDIKETLAALLPRLEQQEDTDFRNKFIARYQEGEQSARDNAQPGYRSGLSGIYVADLINRHAAEDALFACDDGTPVVWTLRHISANAKRRFFSSLLHGTMAGGMASAIGLQKCQPDRQVIAMCGDGGFTMLLGDLLTAVQEKLPIKIVIFNNGKLGFVEIEQKAEGMLNTFTHLQNPNFGDMAKAMGLWGHRVEEGADLERAVVEWLAQPGPALLDVKVNSMELVMPPFIALEPAIGMTLYTAKAILHGKGGEVWEMLTENFL